MIINDIIIFIIFSFNLMIIIVISIGKAITLCDAFIFIRFDIVCFSLEPISSESSVLYYIIIWIPFIFNFFIISSISVGNIIRFFLNNSLSTKDNEALIIKVSLL